MEITTDVQRSYSALATSIVLSVAAPTLNSVVYQWILDHKKISSKATRNCKNNNNNNNKPKDEDYKEKRGCRGVMRLVGTTFCHWLSTNAIHCGVSLLAYGLCHYKPFWWLWPSWRRQNSSRNTSKGVFLSSSVNGEGTATTAASGVGVKAAAGPVAFMTAFFSSVLEVVLSSNPACSRLIPLMAASQRCFELGYLLHRYEPSSTSSSSSTGPSFSDGAATSAPPLSDSSFGVAGCPHSPSSFIQCLLVAVVDRSLSTLVTEYLLHRCTPLRNGEGNGISVEITTTTTTSSSSTLGDPSARSIILMMAHHGLRGSLDYYVTTAALEAKDTKTYIGLMGLWLVAQCVVRTPLELALHVEECVAQVEAYAEEEVEELQLQVKGLAQQVTKKEKEMDQLQSNEMEDNRRKEVKNLRDALRVREESLLVEAAAHKCFQEEFEMQRTVAIKSQKEVEKMTAELETALREHIQKENELRATLEATTNDLNQQLAFSKAEGELLQSRNGVLGEDLQVKEVEWQREQKEFLEIQGKLSAALQEEQVQHRQCQAQLRVKAAEWGKRKTEAALEVATVTQRCEAREVESTAKLDALAAEALCLQKQLDLERSAAQSAMVKHSTQLSQSQSVGQEEVHLLQQLLADAERSKEELATKLMLESECRDHAEAGIGFLQQAVERKDELLADLRTQLQAFGQKATTQNNHSRQNDNNCSSLEEETFQFENYHDQSAGVSSQVDSLPPPSFSWESSATPAAAAATLLLPPSSSEYIDDPSRRTPPRRKEDPPLLVVADGTSTGSGLQLSPDQPLTRPTTPQDRPLNPQQQAEEPEVVPEVIFTTTTGVPPEERNSQFHTGSTTTSSPTPPPSNPTLRERDDVYVEGDAGPSNRATSLLAGAAAGAGAGVTVAGGVPQSRWWLLMRSATVAATKTLGVNVGL